MEENQKNSATFSITTAGGFNVLFTVREADVKQSLALINLVTALDKKFVELGMKPQVKSFGSGFQKKEKDWTGKACPKDGGRLYRLTTKAGKKMIKCENGKYDFQTKTASGCDYFEWVQEPTDDIVNF